MKPLSPLKYYRNNLIKVVPIFVTIVLSVWLIYSLAMIGGTFKTSIKVLIAKPLQYFSLVYTDSKLEANAGLVKGLEKYENIDQVIPIDLHRLKVELIGGNHTFTRILLMGQKNIKTSMDKFDLELSNGRLAQNSQEVMLHWRIARDKNYKVGEELTDSTLQGYKLVGILRGPCVVSVGGVEPKSVDDLLVIQEKGKTKEVNEFLSHLLPHNFGRTTRKEVNKEVKQLENKLVLFFGVLGIKSKEPTLF